MESLEPRAMLASAAFPTVSIAGTTALENRGAAVFPVTLSQSSTSDVRVWYTVVAGTAKPRVNYLAPGAKASIVIPAGKTAGAIRVPTIDDAKYDLDKTFSVRLARVQNAKLDPDKSRILAVGAIVNVDPRPSVRIADASVVEPVRGTAKALFTVTLWNPSYQRIRVHYQTADGTAKAGRDYQASSGTLTFAPGKTTATIGVVVKADRRIRDKEFSVSLSSPVNATLSDALAVGTIKDRRSPAISITSAPAWGKEGVLKGKVSGVNFATHRVAVYIQVEGAGWWTKPTERQRTVPIRRDGTFTADVVSGGLDAYATVYCVAVVDKNDQPPLAKGSGRVPSELKHRAIAFRERYKNWMPSMHCPTVRFAGHTWAIKDASLPAGPGANRFSTRSKDVWVDQQGRMHLTIAKRNESWWSTEAILPEKLGYGTYTFHTSSRLDLLDANAVFGGFTWDPYGENVATSAGGPNREIDIEATRWGDPDDPTNAQFIVQPGPAQRIAIPDLGDDALVTWTITWAPDRVEFTAAHGDYVHGDYPPESVFAHWVHHGEVPSPDQAMFHFNLWLSKPSGPSRNRAVDVVINDFSYTPLG